MKPIEINKIHHGLCLDIIKTFPDKSINMVLTSPPYWQLRDYGFSEQWGMEPTFQEYLEHLWNLMDEIHRVLKDDGTCWINLGDSYNTNHDTGNKFDNEKYGGKNKVHCGRAMSKDLPLKCLCLIPHRFAIGCIDNGWILRNDIIWAKSNGMPESCTDRFSKKHEFVFFFVKNQKYYFDLGGIRDKLKESSLIRSLYASRSEKTNQGICGGMTLESQKKYFNKIKSMKAYNNKKIGGQVRDNHDIHNCYNFLGKNPGDVSDFWDISTKSSREKHFATFNTELLNKPIIAGCPEGGVILDPFSGMGTTLLRAKELKRNYIGIEGNAEYHKRSEEILKSVIEPML